MNKMSQLQRDLIESMIPEVKKISRFILKRRDEDFEQTALTILCELVAIGWTDPVYIFRRLRDRLKNEIREYARENRVRFVRGFDAAVHVVRGDTDVLDDVINNEFLSLLADDERRAVELRMSGHKLREIAEDLGISFTEIKVMMERIQRKIRKYFYE